MIQNNSDFNFFKTSKVEMAIKNDHYRSKRTIITNYLVWHFLA